MRIGIICPSDIAFRRFLPALKESGCFEYAGVAVASREEFSGATDDVLAAEHLKAQIFINNYGGQVYEGYQSLLESSDVDAVYIPLPPGLHYLWAQRALNAGKHILVEKPCTTALSDTKNLVSLANVRNLAIHENYMFAYHEQLKALSDIILRHEIGDVRLYRIAFGFPLRAQGDFRYNKNLGGGALLDCGGYTLRYASMLLGPTAELRYAQCNYMDCYHVDMYGSAALVNEDGVTAQVAFGMDNEYKCELEVWGSRGTIVSNRVLTAPTGFIPEVIIRKGAQEERRALPADDAFEKSIRHFHDCIMNKKAREANVKVILRQAELVERFKILAKMNI